MTKEELRRKIEEVFGKLGGRADEVFDDIQKRIDQEKEKLDTETRRKVRAFWAPVGFAVGFTACYLAGWLGLI